MISIRLTHGFYADGKEFSPKNYLHKYSKEVVLNWFKNDGIDKEFWDYTQSFNNLNDGKSFRPNRKCGIWVDYPIVIDGSYNSVERNWDELYYWEDKTYDKTRQYDFPLDKSYKNDKEKEYINSRYKQECHFDCVPTIEECKILNVKIIKLMCVVISHKGRPELYIHLYDKKRMSAFEINELRKCDIKNLIEINVRWIMKQTERPEILEYFQLIDEL